MHPLLGGRGEGAIVPSIILWTASFFGNSLSVLRRADRSTLSLGAVGGTTGNNPEPTTSETGTSVVCVGALLQEVLARQASIGRHVGDVLL